MYIRIYSFELFGYNERINIYSEKVDHKIWKKAIGNFAGYRTSPSNYGALTISENKYKKKPRRLCFSNIYVLAKKIVGPEPGGPVGLQNCLMYFD